MLDNTAFELLAKLFDEDGDGIIEFDELSNCPGVNNEFIKRLISIKFDTDESGQISLKELGQYLKQVHEDRRDPRKQGWLTKFFRNGLSKSKI